MTRRRYVQGYNGKWIKPKMRGYKVACCDCGLVHRYEYRLVNVRGRQTLIYRADRDYRATSARRRRASLAKIKRALA